MFSDWLEKELSGRGWSHSELARRAGLSQVQVSGVISGQRKPGCEFCIKVAQALELSPVLILVKAGILPTSPGADDSPIIQEIVELSRSLSPADQTHLLEYIRFMYQQQLRGQGRGHSSLR